MLQTRITPRVVLPQQLLRPRTSIRMRIRAAPLATTPSTQTQPKAFPSSLRKFHSSPLSLVSTPIHLSDPGEGISEVELIKWHITEGASINEFDPLCEVQSDKASVEITSRHQGTVASLKWKVGQIVKVGDVLCEVDVQGGEHSNNEEQPKQQEAVAESSTSTSETMYEQQRQQPEKSQLPQADPETPDHIRSLAVPSVRRLCREHNLQVTDIRGTGKDGRVMKEDVLKYLQDRDSPSQSSAIPSSTPSPTATVNSTQAQPLTGTRKAMFKSLSLSTSIPHFTFSEEVDVTDLEAMRKQVNADLLHSSTSTSTGAASPLPPPPPRITLLSYLLKALSMTLETNPIFTHRLVTSPSNSSSIAEQANAARLHPQTSHDISIALSTSSGLLTPTLVGLQRKSILDIAREIHNLQTHVNNGGTLTAAQMGNGGLLTLSNIGSVGGTAASPVLPPTGQLAIGAVCKARWVPRYAAQEGEGDEQLQTSLPTPRLVLPATFAGDHRVLQGTELAKLVCDWKRLCERPYTWSARMV